MDSPFKVSLENLENNNKGCRFSRLGNTNVNFFSEFDYYNILSQENIHFNV